MCPTLEHADGRHTFRIKTEIVAAVDNWMQLERSSATSKRIALTNHL